MTLAKPFQETSELIPGPSGVLEACFYPGDRQEIGIMCHPHPLYEGSMQNKVVTTVVRTWQLQGFSTLRFNFRGVGKSSGTFAKGKGELEDLRAVIQWLQHRLPHARLWLAGFSFGSFIALQMALELPSCQGLITIAPALRIFDFSTLALPTCPWMVIQGDQDEFVSTEDFERWYTTLEGQKNLSLHKIPEASHFFHGKLANVAQHVHAFTEQFSI